MSAPAEHSHIDSKRATTILLIGIVCLGAFLRLNQLGAKSLWMDELTTVQKYNQATSLRGLTYLAAQHSQPPLDYLVGFLIARVYEFGSMGEFVHRLPAAVYSIIMIPLVFVVAASVTGRWTALLASLFVAMSPGLVAYAQEVRPYALFFLLYLCVVAVLYRAVRFNHPFDWVALCVCTFLMLMSKGLAPVAVAIGIGASLAICSPWLVRAYSEGSGWGAAAKLLGKAACAIGVAAIAFIPFLRVTVALTPPLVRDTFELGELAADALAFDRLFAIAGSVYPHMLGESWPVVLVLYLVGAYMACRSRRSRPWVLFVFVLSVVEPVVHGGIFSAVAGPVPLKLRYVLHSMPLVLVVACMGLVAAARAVWERSRAAGVLCAAVPAGLILASDVRGLSAYYATPKSDYRAIGAYIARDVQRTDDVLLFYFTPYRPGRWYPPLYGEGLYFHDLRQWYLHDFIEQTRDSLDEPNNLHFVLCTYKWPESAKPELGLDSAAYHVEQHYGLSVVRVRDRNLTRREALLRMLADMERFYPPTSARVRLYLNKANLICEDQPEAAARYLAMAQEWVPDASLGQHCAAGAGPSR